MKKLLAILLATVVSSQVFADYRLVVPQQPGGGTDIWARIVAKELEKKLGERIIVENIPGINDTPGFNKFHNELRKDPKVIMVAHGGNAEAYLTQKVDYDYHQYSLIGLQNLTIIVGKRNDQNVEKELRFAAGSGQNPDAMALTMLQCGPQPDLQAYLNCYNKRVIYVPGMGGGVRRLAYMNGELNVTRETTAAYLKNVKPLKQNVDWFTHGVLDLDTGRVVRDPNFPTILFSDVYARRWGDVPRGDFYEAYLLVKNYRDVLQKSLWVDKNNPNRARLESALKAMVADPVSLAAIEKDTGKYEWIIGEQAGVKVLNTLQSMTTERNLKNLVWWMDNAFDQKVVYKPELIRAK
jgi:hypothetical protein